MSSDITRLPLLPLPNVVLFPGMALPLLIFEDRYKAMMKDILTGDKRFGVLLCREYNPETLNGIPFDVGTVAEVLDCEELPDGKMNIVSIGRQRFDVQNYDNEEKPYLIGEVTWLEDTLGGVITSKLIQETTTHFMEALRMTHKILDKPFEPLVDIPAQPEELSFLIAENLKGSLILKQDLLEMTETRMRLEYERDVLKKIVKTLAVRSQIESVFRESTEET